MKKANKIYGKILVSSLCVAAAGWLAVQGQEAPIGGFNQPNKQIQTKPAPGQPLRMNKCSQVLGSNVENQQGEKLGRIDEVVVDYQTSRVSYCVLTVGGGIFSSPKYLAVPLAALVPSEDGSHLILNADKSKVAQAQGFERDNWPSVTNPSWGTELFWQPTPQTTIMPSNQKQNSPSSTSH